MSSTVPKVAVAAILDRVGEKSFERGEKYFRSGAIFDAKRQGLTIKARCEGSQGGPYRVSVTFDAKGKVAEAECSCPVGDGGYCKHVAALMLTWRARPGEFVEVEDVESSLERRSKPELIALVKQMLRREPDLERLLETPLPGSRGRSKQASPDVYRRQAAAVFRGYDPYDHGYGYGYGGSGVADELEPLLDDADTFLAQGDPAAASAVYEGVADALSEHYETVDDESGDLAEVFARCVEGLGTCLKELKGEPARREAILKALVAAHDFDYGDAAADVPDLIVEYATVEERRTVAGWLRDKLSKRGRDEFSRYRREGYARFLVELEKDVLSDEDHLRICREAGLAPELIGRLLKLGRTEEAVAELKRAQDHEILRLADLFVARRQGELAEQVIRERLAKSKGWSRVQWMEWLKRRAHARRDRAAVRELAESIFHEQPSFERYKELRQLAGKSGGWDALRTKLLERLEKSDRADLIRVYLDEGLLDEAIAAVQAKVKSRSPYDYGASYGYGMRLEVAKAAEAKRPRAALELYRDHAERLIEARGRENYKVACRYLKKVKALHETLGESKEWDYYVGVLRERNRTLRAFQEELKTAKL
jgi:uncharacterized Zn finger protein